MTFYEDDMLPSCQRSLNILCFVRTVTSLRTALKHNIYTREIRRKEQEPDHARTVYKWILHGLNWMGRTLFTFEDVVIVFFPQHALFPFTLYSENSQENTQKVIRQYLKPTLHWSPIEYILCNLPRYSNRRIRRFSNNVLYNPPPPRKKFNQGYARARGHARKHSSKSKWM
jgi:hypothetical protein